MNGAFGQSGVSAINSDKNKKGNTLFICRILFQLFRQALRQEQVRRQRSYPLRKPLPQAYPLRTAALPHILLFFFSSSCRLASLRMFDQRSIKQKNQQEKDEIMKAIHVPPIHTNKYENSQSDEKHISGCHLLSSGRCRLRAVLCIIFHGVIIRQKCRSPF